MIYPCCNFIFPQETRKRQSKTIKTSLKDQYIGVNIRQKVRLKFRQMDLDIFLNQILLESIDYLFYFIQMNMLLL